MGVSVARRVEQKIIASAKYNCRYSMHLLAWSSTITTDKLATAGQDQELIDYIQSDGMGRFDRIWVFGRSETCIAFDSSDWSFANG